MFEAGRANRALGTDIFGWLCVLVTGWVENHGIEAATGSVLTPGLLHGEGMVFLWMRDKVRAASLSPRATDGVRFRWNFPGERRPSAESVAAHPLPEFVIFPPCAALGKG
jgi:hypothetical protein